MCLRAADVNTLENMYTNISFSGFYGTYLFVPVVDGTFIVERPTMTLNKKKFNGVCGSPRDNPDTLLIMRTRSPFWQLPTQTKAGYSFL